MTTIKDKITAELKLAQKNRDEIKLSVNRLLLSEIHNEEIAKRQPLTDEQVTAVLAQAAKKHRDSIAQFKTGQRADLVAKEEAELEIINSYLPEQIGEPELRQLVKEAVAAISPQGPQDFGKVMQALMPKIKGRADGSVVSAMVKEQLH